VKYAQADDGVVVPYDVFGRRNAPAVLMIQGLGTDSRGWAVQRLTFGRRYRCVAVDNRGSGESSDAPRPLSLLTMAEDAVCVLDAEGIERAHIVGASMGGVIAQILAVAHPERVDGLVLACTSCRHHEWRRELFTEWRSLVLERGMSALATDGLRWLIGPRLHQRFGRWLDLLARILMQASPEGFAAQIDALLNASDDLRFELAAIHTPTLVVTGSQDALTPIGDAEELLELIDGAQFAELRGAAHGMMVEQPSAFNATVLGFLEEVEARRPTGDVARRAS